MTKRIKKVACLFLLSMPLLFTAGCGTDTETAWWLASPWSPFEWFWAPADAQGNIITGPVTGSVTL